MLYYQGRKGLSNDLMSISKSTLITTIRIGGISLIKTCYQLSCHLTCRGNLALNLEFEFKFCQKFFFRRRLHPLQQRLRQRELGSDTFTNRRNRFARLEWDFRRKFTGQFAWKNSVSIIDAPLWNDVSLLDNSKCETLKTVHSHSFSVVIVSNISSYYLFHIGLTIKSMLMVFR